MNTSTETATIFKALSKAQGAMGAITKDVTSETTKKRYASLGSIWGVIRKPLSENNLAIIQLPEKEGLITLLVHESGQFIANLMVYPDVSDLGMNKIQSTGSLITYLKRYAISAMLGISTEDDDDGQSRAPTIESTDPVIPMPKATDNGMGGSGFQKGKVPLNIKNSEPKGQPINEEPR